MRPSGVQRAAACCSLRQYGRAAPRQVLALASRFSVCGAAPYCSRACQALDRKRAHEVPCVPMDRWLISSGAIGSLPTRPHTKDNGST